ncbi:Cell fate regulator YaaT, PSP1 superfamily (controls sporulation, competence, biofilm development) [Abditibacterium utsteinense]|uniref:Cell fate regulator YaaT, PSP1 superfamily (Controls sporulation, competence, biofilm development) n=1 Tax=Abditibacterium utsteinense TaxID=1960156 RepID=A0A2S8SXE8_9BACT|nr:regulatory iron-sulfur-containing complex subunit RicT [Abditibacterium utsteinense]PQV65481.1 Cell fate regulator YaaT, PSP1 superfamily (controls sporulation, competence, biofilm development) [Abditibacterium utsteinense]
MPWVATCTFREPVKSYYIEAGDLELGVGTPILAETARGLELGTVKFRPREVPDDKIVPPLRGVSRIASAQDVAQDVLNREWEIEALAIARARIREHKLEMKAVKCETMFDRSKLYVFYESEERVDFRELLRDLAGKLSVRLHLQHVGPREAAKVLGGCGPCGQTLCCSTFLKETPGVNLKLAKEQRLSLTPSKISGACGRLMCCLRYEIDFYRDANLRLPKNGSPVDTPEGPGIIVDVNVFTEKCNVRLGDGRHIEVEGETLRALREERGIPKGCSSSVSSGGSCTKGVSWAKKLEKTAAN